MNINPVFLNHFANTEKERYVILQGSSRSGKTYSCLQWFYLLAQMGFKFEITIVGKTIPFLRDGAVNLFTEIAPNHVLIKNPFSVKINNAKFLFRSYDTVQDAKGAERDYLYVNECNDIKKEIIDQLIIRTRKQVFFDFNPTKEFWIDEYKNERNFLKTTFKDNPYLTANQIAEFERIREAAQQPGASVYDKWYYTVYYLGEYGRLQGNVFNKVYQIDEDTFETETEMLKSLYGIDFGFSTDPTVIPKVAQFENKIYIKQVYYRNQTDDFQLAEVINERIHEANARIVYEYASGGDARIANLRRLTKKNYIKATKGTIESDIGLIQGFEYYICGEKIYKEFLSYEYIDGEFSETNNHGIDATKYAMTYGLRSGIFKSTKTIEIEE